MTGGEPVDGVDLGHALHTPEAVPLEGVLSQLTQEPAPGVPRPIRLGIDRTQEIVWKGHHHLCHVTSMPGNAKNRGA